MWLSLGMELMAPSKEWSIHVSPGYSWIPLLQVRGASERLQNTQG